MSDPIRTAIPNEQTIALEVTSALSALSDAVDRGDWALAKHAREHLEEVLKQLKLLEEHRARRDPHTAFIDLSDVYPKGTLHEVYPGAWEWAKKELEKVHARFTNSGFFNTSDIRQTIKHEVMSVIEQAIARGELRKEEP